MNTIEPSNEVLSKLDSEDELFESLEREDDVAYEFRERRLEQLKKEFALARDMQQNHHGTYMEVNDEKQILEITTQTPKVVIHFMHPDFRRCAILHTHLRALALKYFKTRFLYAHVEKVPFLVDRLKIQVLPCVIYFIDGIAKDRLIGFEELGNTDSFTTAVLERHLLKSGVIEREMIHAPTKTQKGIFRTPEHDDDDDDDEWD